MKTSLFLEKAAMFILILFGIIQIAGAQNVTITDDDTHEANVAAMLDVYSTNKGLLVPRVALVSATDPISVTKPDGLLVWNTQPGTYAVGYYYWNGTDWSPVGAGVGNGLTFSGSKIEFGGTLEKATTLNTGGNPLTIGVNGSGTMSINLASTGDFTIYDNGSSSSCFTFQDNGNVGIGLTSPLHTLHINHSTINTAGNDGTYIDVQNSYNTSYVQTGIRFANYPTVSSAYFRAGLFYRRTNLPAYTDGDLYLANNSGAAVDYSDAALIVKPDQKIGIGTSSPGALLQVAGDLMLSTGSAVNEFSTDGTLGGKTPSDNAVPTEKALKTYIDNNAGAGFTGTGSVNYIPKWTSSSALGSSILYQNSNKIGIGTKSPTSKLVVYGDAGISEDSAIFEVKNNSGQTVFAVYPKGVRINVDYSTVAKGVGSHGGFAVGGFGTKGSVDGQDYFHVTADSVRVYFDETSKAVHGGFAVGGYGTKGINSTMSIEPENYFIGHSAGKKTTGGFNSFFGYYAGSSNTTGSMNIFIGHYAGLSNVGGSSNVAIGPLAAWYHQSGDNNVCIGLGAGAYNRTGVSNIFIGNYAGVGNSTTSSGSNNTVLGVYAGNAITTGNHNCLIGYNAGYNLETGSSNVAIGDSAGYQMASGIMNVFVGSGTGVNTSTSSYSTYLGYGAGVSMNGYSNSFVGYRSGGGYIYATPGTGGYNTAMGSYSLWRLTTGSHNVCVGNYAGNYITTTSNNTFLGYYAGSGYSDKISRISQSGNTGSGNVFIGYKAGTGEPFNVMSDKLVIHNDHAATVNDVLIYGDFSSKQLQFNANVGVGYGSYSSYGLVVKGGTTNSLRVYSNGQSYVMYVGGNSQIAGTWSSTSDFRLKKNIAPINSALEKVKELNGVTFNWKSEDELREVYNGISTGDTDPEELNNRVKMSEDKQVGVIAQDVEKVLPELVKTDEYGIKSVNYDGLIPVLIQAIKEQQQQIELQSKEIEKLKALTPKSSVTE